MKLDHAILDKESRLKKTAKIIRIVEKRKHLKGANVLEVGAGSGITALSLVDKCGATGVVHAIDVKDQRIATEGYEFKEVGDTCLPFQDAQFDIVISNHVIEHVGGEVDQLRHLSEIKRVMKPDALLYLAVPNRWSLIEPHYRIPFLSWMPKSFADVIVRMSGKNDEYDCRPLSRWKLRRLFAVTGFRYKERDREALQAVAAIEQSVIAKQMSQLPVWILNPLLLVVPTLVVTASTRK